MFVFTDLVLGLLQTCLSWIGGLRRKIDGLCLLELLLYL